MASTQSLGIAVLALFWSAHAVAGEIRQPNVVFLLADDLGWTDLACYGSDLHETPNLDRLAKEGVRFTRAHAMSVCSPSRAAILTGKHAARLHITIWREGSLERTQRAAASNWPLLDPATAHDLPHAEETIGEALKSAGYLTFHVGKWHLGDAEHSPETQGFDVNIGGTHWGAPATYFWPFRGPDRSNVLRYVPGLGPGKPGEYLTDRLTDEALELIDAAGDRPFFLNLWFHNPHYYPTTTPVSAVRAGDWKLLEYHEDGRVELYNLRDDAGEKLDLSASQPDRAAKLRESLHAWRKEVGAQMPTPNPAFQPKR